MTRMKSVFAALLMAAIVNLAPLSHAQTTVKVVLAEDGRALFFSRAPIPWDRDRAVNAAPGPDSYQGALNRP